MRWLWGRGALTRHPSPSTAIVLAGGAQPLCSNFESSPCVRKAKPRENLSSGAEKRTAASSGGGGHSHAGIGGELLNVVLLQVRLEPGTMRPPACLILALLVSTSRYLLVKMSSLLNAVVVYVSDANTIEKSIRW